MKQRPRRYFTQAGMADVCGTLAVTIPPFSFRQERTLGRIDERMSPNPKCVSSETPLLEVADAFALDIFGAMPVVDEGKLNGIISHVNFLKLDAASS